MNEWIWIEHEICWRVFTLQYNNHYEIMTEINFYMDSDFLQYVFVCLSIPKDSANVAVYKL